MNPHKTYCNYEVAKANKPKQIRAVRVPTQPKGFKTSNMSKAMLARQIATLF